MQDPLSSPRPPDPDRKQKSSEELGLKHNDEARELDCLRCQKLERPTRNKQRENIANRNKRRVIWDIGRLIVPAPEELARGRAINLLHLIETVDEGLVKAILLVKGPRPQPDFAVGFKSSSLQLRYLGNCSPLSVIGGLQLVWW